MCWAPIYIQGKQGFQEALVAKMATTWLRGNTDGEINLLMFWLRKKGELHDFKKAIGSRLIFKYRMHFITDLELHLNRINKRPDHFSDFENNLISTMKNQDPR
jgi:hypothetical protein